MRRFDSWDAATITVLSVICGSVVGALGSSLSRKLTTYFHQPRTCKLRVPIGFPLHPVRPYHPAPRSPIDPLKTGNKIEVAILAE